MMDLWTSGALRDILSQDNVNEVMINGPHNVFVETNGVMTRYEDTEGCFTLNYLNEIATLVANYTRQAINAAHPILSATLSTSERIQVVMPPACDFKQFVISIRKPSVHQYSLEDYQDHGFFDLSVKDTHSEVDDRLAFHRKRDDFVSFFKLAVSGKKTIVVSGGAGSGKTTFTNCLTNYIHEFERLITIEDAREVLTGELDKRRNVVNLLTSPEALNKPAVTFADLVKACLRLRPDRIMLSELRGSEAFDFLNGVNTGHNGSITSIHANTASSVYDRMVTMIKMSDAGSNLSRNDIYDYCKNSIDIIVHCDKTSGRWCMQDLIYV